MFVDIGIIVVLLIGLIVGIVRGTAKSIIKFVSLVAGLILTWYLTPFIMKFVFDTDFLNQSVFGEQFSLYALFKNTAVYSQYESSVVLKALCAPLISQTDAILQAQGIALTVQQCFPYVLAAYSATIIVAFIVYLVVRLLIMIIAAIIKAIFLKYKPKPVSRVIGGIIGMVNSVVAVLWIFLLTSSIIPQNTLTAPVLSQADKSLGVQWTYGFVQEGVEKVMVKDSYIAHAIKEAEKAINSAEGK